MTAEITIDGNASITLVSSSGAQVYIYKGQIWATPDLTEHRRIARVGSNKKIAQVYWKTKDGDENTKSSIDEFLWWAIQSDAKPIVAMVIDRI